MAKKLSNDDPESLKSVYFDWISKKRQDRFTILVTGKTGVGKSRLVNALVGKRVALEGRLRTTFCTDRLASYRAEVNHVQVTVWDSPGLQDGSCNERLYLQDMKSKLSQGFDVMIYCLSMTDMRLYDPDKHAIRSLTETFGSKLWKNAVVALTFANLKIHDPDEEDDLAYFMGEIYLWEEAIDKLLRDVGVDSQVRKDLPIVPTGNYKKLRLPTCENWISELWVSCFCVMSISSGLALYRVSENRLKFPGGSAANTSTFAEARGPASAANTSTVPAARGPASAANTSTVPAAFGPAFAEDENHMLIAETEETQSARGDLADHDLEEIPREIPLNEEQEDRVLKSLWKAFKDGCRAAKNFITDKGHRVLRFFTRRGNDSVN